MAGQETVSITIINRNYPPGQGITGESASELAEFLITRGIEVNIVHVNALYKGGHNTHTQAGNVIKVNTFYNGKNKFIRLFSNLYEGYKLVTKAKRLRTDVIICMTDPPLLNFWASLLLTKKQKWILWSMDLYPEAFIAGKLVTHKNLAYKFIDKAIKKYPPHHIISLGEYQSESLRKKFNTVSFTILPCGIYNKDDRSNKNKPIPHWATDRSKIYLGYCGNIGEAHSNDFLFAIINNINPQKHKLILAVYGTNADKIINYAKGREGVVIIDSVNRSELKFIDIHLASLIKDWVNISVPSKTVSSVCSGSAFLYYGSKNSDNWSLLQNAGWIIEDTDVEIQIKSFLNSIDMGEVNRKKQAAEELAISLHSLKTEAFEKIWHTINQLKTGKKEENIINKESLSQFA